RQMTSNLLLLLRKIKSSRVQFPYRMPDYEHPEYGDMDASWWSNPVDIKCWFVMRGQEIVKYQTEGKSSFLKELSSAVQIIIRKTN
ncbi:MAG: hypothetical protein Q8O74_03475, partial [bacterium]|nr:hypothetical protein [bacterium]